MTAAESRVASPSPLIDDRDVILARMHEAILITDYEDCIAAVQADDLIWPQTDGCKGFSVMDFHGCGIIVCVARNGMRTLAATADGPHGSDYRELVRIHGKA